MSNHGFNQSEQVFISEMWTGTGGQTAVFYHNVSKTDGQDNVYVAGSTLNASDNHDIIIQKFNRNGDLLWQETFNGSANMDDMAADLYIDDNYNVYVTGTTTSNSETGFDLTVLKYNNSGVLQWQYDYNNNGQPYPYDAGTAITGDNNGSIFVTGGSFGTTSMSDYVTVRLNAVNGAEIWTKRYNYDDMNDLAAKIAFKTGEIVVTGASQIGISPEEWELATLSYSVSDGTLLIERRSSGSATDGVDEVHDLTIDIEGNVYIAGAVKNNDTDYDIRIYKLDDELNIVWEEDFDGYELSDKAYGIKVNDAGDVYATGYTTHPTQGKNFITLKYDSTGTLLWKREYNGQANANDEGIQLVLDNDNRVFVTGEVRNAEHSDYVIIGYYSDGTLFGQAIFEGPAGLDDRPSGMAIDMDGNIIVTGQTEEPEGEVRNRTVKYGIYSKIIDPVIIDSIPSHNADELLIRFDRSVMNYGAVDNKAFTAGQLSDFVKPQVIDSMNAVTGLDFKRYEAFKVFFGMTTADTLSITRLGDTIKVKDFWGTLSVMIPSGGLDVLVDTLQSVFPYINGIQKNYFGQLADVPDDPQYNGTGQFGLHNEQYGINIEPAWGIQVSQEYTKVGIYDSGINWPHYEFGGEAWETNKIAGGMYGNGMLDIWNFDGMDFVGHGTAVAGIVGALRNNDYGMAGIAGGSALDGNIGCELYDFQIPWYIDWYPEELPFAMSTLFIPKIIAGAVDNPNSDYGFGLHVQNHSWYMTPYAEFFAPLFEDAILTCYKNSCALVAASGNFGAEQILYPASYNDDWVIKVGANDYNGERASFSNYGFGLDLVAPGDGGTMYSFLSHDVNNQVEYAGANGWGTSYAAPHVSGVVALMHSEHNLNNPNYDYPNDLAPEDYEAVLQKNTFEAIDGQGYGEFIGHGRMNAGVALEDMSLPEAYILHIGDDPSSVSISDNSSTIFATENIEGLPGIPYGSHSAQKYQVDQTFIETLPITDVVVDHWPRFSSSHGVSDLGTIPEETFFEYNVDIQGNTVSINTTTYVWKVTVPVDNGSGSIILMDTWYPDHPDNAKTAVSLHIKDGDVVSNVTENSLDVGIKIFPNPNNGKQMVLEYLSDIMTQNAQMSIYDKTGRIVLDRKLTDQTRHVISLPSLSQGMYYININNGDQVLSKKFIVH